MTLSLKRGREDEDGRLIPWLWGRRFNSYTCKPKLAKDLDVLGGVCDVVYHELDVGEPPFELPSAIVLTENGEMKDWDPSPRGSGCMSLLLVRWFVLLCILPK